METVAILIQAYDDLHDPLPPVAPGQMLACLLETSGRTTKDIVPVFGTRGRVTKVLSGKRSIGKLQARQLGVMFKVTSDLFL